MDTSLKWIFTSLILFLAIGKTYTQSSYFVDIQYFGLEEGLKSLSVQQIIKDRHGVLWLSGGSGITRFDGRDFVAFTKTNGKLPFQGIKYMAEDEAGYLWLLQPCKHPSNCRGRLVFFNPVTYEVLTVEERFGERFPIHPKVIKSLSANTRKKITFNTPDETYTWSLDEGFKTEDNEKTQTNLIFEAPDSLIWDFKSGQYTISHPTKGLIYDLKNEHTAFQQNLEVNDVLFDEYGTAWIASDYGLLFVQLKKKPFQTILHTPTDGVFLPQTIQVNSIAPSSDGFLCFSTNEGVYVQRNGQTEKLSVNLQNTPAIFAEEFHNDQLLMVSKYGLYSLKTVNGSFTFKAFSEPVSTGSVTCVKKINENILWIGTAEGVYEMNLSTNEVYKLQTVNKYKEIHTARINHFYKKGKNVWISTSIGVYQHHEKEGIINRFYTEITENHLPGHYFYQIYEGKDGTHWVGTNSGLVKWELGTANYEHFPIKGENVIGRVYRIFEDDYGNLWWSTRKKGIVQFFTKEKTSIGYTVTDGLPHRGFHILPSWQSPSGQLYFGSPNGVATFHPKDFPTQSKSVEENLIVLDYEQFSQRNKSISRKNLALAKHKKIVLRPSDGFFSIKVSLQDYANAKRFRYRYMIKGLDDVWVEGYENTIRISGLPYGKYTLVVQGRLLEGLFSKPLEIPIQVIRPFYLRWWFILAMLMVLATSGYYAYQWRIQSLKNRQEELEEAVNERTRKIEEDKQTIEAQAEELKELDEMKSRFFANVSHELRTPLTLILAPIQNILKRNQISNKDYTQLLLAQKNSQKLGKMINQILDLTKLEAGKLELNTSTVVWYNTLRSIAANFESLANSKNIDFQFRYEGNEYLQVKLDKEKFEIILVNLLSNAFKFTPNGGTIKVTAQSKGEFLQFFVQDTGKGIHPDDLSNVFNRFYQTKQKDAAAEGGTGIGLALSKEFVELMEGKIWVESEWLKGATFHVHIPRIEVFSQVSDDEAILISDKKTPISQPEIESVEATEEKISEDKKTILLVEDNVDLRHFIKQLLSEKYHVITAENGKEALERLQVASSELPVDKQNIKQRTDNRQLLTGNPQLIISDIMMPIMDGYQLLEKLKSDKQYQQIPIIMLTARAAKDDRLKALRIGVDDYILKPFDEEELFVRIENLIRNVRNRQAIAVVATGEEAIVEPEEETPIYSEEDQEWLIEVETVVIERLKYFDFSVTDLSQQLTTNRWQLNNRIKSLTGLTAQQYIQEVRLNQARTLLESNEVNTVKAASLAVGMKSIKYFSKQFKTRFGKSPSAYL